MDDKKFSELIDSLSKVLELVFLIEKDISGVRLRSASILLHDELRKQVEMVIGSIEEDMKKVETGINPLKKYFMLRKNALNSINNLTSSLEQMINESTSIEEIQESIRLFSKSAQEEFVLTILQLEKLWNQEIMDIMESMKKVISIMQVTHEKLIRYKRECNIQEDYGSDIGNLLEQLLKGNLEEFKKAEKDLRSRILPEI
ncbi:MAG TPA: hypothetical protein VMV49_03505 [Candidatus Deferrimicrobium sp.]|nr:hypothetical protein [Candidatus Deferrimicrobium sp.]